MEKLDKKFYGHLFKVKDTTHVSDDTWVVFLAKDNAFAAVLPLYVEKCRELGCDEEQIKAVEKLLVDVNKWRDAHPELCKNPDAKNERLLT